MLIGPAAAAAGRRQALAPPTCQSRGPPRGGKALVARACLTTPTLDVFCLRRGKPRACVGPAARQVLLVNRARIATIAAVAIGEEGQEIVWTTDT